MLNRCNSWRGVCVCGGGRQWRLTGRYCGCERMTRGWLHDGWFVEVYLDIPSALTPISFNPRASRVHRGHQGNRGRKVNREQVTTSSPVPRSVYVWQPQATPVLQHNHSLHTYTWRTCYQLFLLQITKHLFGVFHVQILLLKCSSRLSSQHFMFYFRALKDQLRAWKEAR